MELSLWPEDRMSSSKTVGLKMVFLCPVCSCLLRATLQFMVWPKQFEVSPGFERDDMQNSISLNNSQSQKRGLLPE